jgi:hypothetical protein
VSTPDWKFKTNIDFALLKAATIWLEVSIKPLFDMMALSLGAAVKCLAYKQAC